MWVTESMSSMGIAPSSTLSPNIAETSNQQDHWLCELSLVASALPCLALPRSVGAAPSGPRCRAEQRRTHYRGQVRCRNGAQGGRNGATHPGAALPGGTEAGTLLGDANPRQKAGNRAKTGISNAINTCHTLLTRWGMLQVLDFS